MNDLQQAAAVGNTDQAGQLLDLGIDPNTGEDILSPLARACQSGHLPMVKLLLSRGADPHWKDVSGRSTLDYISHMNLASGTRTQVERLLRRYPREARKLSKKTIPWLLCCSGWLVALWFCCSSPTIPESTFLESRTTGIPDKVESFEQGFVPQMRPKQMTEFEAELLHRVDRHLSRPPLPLSQDQLKREKRSEAIVVRERNPKKGGQQTLTLQSSLDPSYPRAKRKKNKIETSNPSEVVGLPDPPPPYERRHESPVHRPDFRGHPPHRLPPPPPPFERPNGNRP